MITAKVSQIIVTGPFQSGKTTFIQSISEIGVVFTDAPNDKSHVAHDYGRITVAENLVVNLFGTPGTRRSDFAINLLRQSDALGYVVMVDSSAPVTFPEAQGIFAHFETNTHKPCVIAANKQDLEAACPVDEVRDALKIDAKIPVLPCVATEPESVKAVLRALLYQILITK